MEPTTGVTAPNKTACEWFWEEDYIDPEFDYFREVVINEKVYELEQEGTDPEEAKEESEEWFDNHGCDNYEESNVLYGSWKKDKNGLWEPDSEKGDYAAIYRGGSYGSYVLQVIWSKWGIYGAWCSPCYPGQVDIDTPGDNAGYCLPPELLDEKWYEENKERIFEI